MRSDEVGDELRRLRPDLLTGYRDALPGARAAVLARLLGALSREPLPGLNDRRPGRVTVAGTTVTFPTEAGLPFAAAAAGLHVTASARPDRAGAPDTPTGDRRPGPARATGDPTTGHHPGTPGATVIEDPAALVRLLWPGARLADEITDSVTNLALARAAGVGAGATLAGAAGDPDGLGRLEQAVVDGHPLHPGCRTRLPMSVADVLAYAPEHRTVTRLRRLRVPAERWSGAGPPVLYAHPWQARRLTAEYGWLTDDGLGAPVRPLMSLRTVAPLDGGPHVKTAVDVQLTSAVRTVSPAAVHNGPRMSHLLARLTADLPLTVLAESDAGAVLIDGRPQRRLAHLHRRAPRPGPGESVVPLAALGAGRPPLISEAVTAYGGNPYAWFQDLARVLWPPLFTLLRRGVALEAHGQNTLLVLAGGRPDRILYRDLGGVRVDPRLFDAHGDLGEPDPAARRTVLLAATVSTVATDLVTLLSRHHGADPARLWAVVAAATGDDGGPLPVKAMTAMRLAGDPLAGVWAWLDNPMAARP